MTAQVSKLLPLMSIHSYQEAEIPSIYAQAKALEDRIVDEARDCGYDEDELFALRLSLEEALTNAIRHGNQSDTSKKVNVRYYISPEQIDLYIADEGPGFDPTKVPDPTAEENIENPNGRGIMLMRAYMNLVEYNDKGNVIHIMKLKPQPEKTQH